MSTPDFRNLRAALQRGLASFSLAFVAGLCGVTGAEAAGCQGANQPAVYGAHTVSGTFANDLGAQLLHAFGRVVSSETESAGCGVRWLDRDLFAGTVQRDVTDLQLGGNADTGRYRDIWAVDFVLVIKFFRDSDSASAQVQLVALDGTVLQASEVRFQSDLSDRITQTQAVAKAFSAGLGSRLRAQRVRPVVPQVSVTVDRQELPAGERVNVTATVVDLDTAAPAARVPVKLEHVAPSRTTSLVAIGETDAAGQVRHSFVSETAAAIATSPDGLGRITARSERSDGAVADSNAASYKLVDPKAQMTASTGKAMVSPRSSETLCATLRKDGSPVVGKPIGFGATDGNLLADVAATGANGEACVPYQAPPRNALVDLVASTAPSPVEPAQQALTSVVVDAGVVFNASGPASIVAGGAATLNFDLTQNGLPLVGTPVNFLLDGPGLLSGNVAQTDAAGRVDLVYLAPANAGAATITASTNVDGQNYNRSVTVATSEPPAVGMTVETESQVTSIILYNVFGYEGNFDHAMFCSDGTARPWDHEGWCTINGPRYRPPFEMAGQVGSALASSKVTMVGNQVTWSYSYNCFNGSAWGAGLTLGTWFSFTQAGTLKNVIARPGPRGPFTKRVVTLAADGIRGSVPFTNTEMNVVAGERILLYSQAVEAPEVCGSQARSVHFTFSPTP